MALQGRVTDRYTKAIDQLGSDKLDVRIGGIYALERIARDSARDHPTIMEVLAAFVREHSREQWPKPAEGGGGPPLRGPRPDVQAAVTVIGRRTVRHDSQPVDLMGADLNGAHLVEANLNNANLRWVNLTGAFLSDANLSGAALFSADLTKAHLFKTNLTNAAFGGADLADALLAGANLTYAGLNDANLNGADLIEANLDGAQLTSARWPSDTPVPVRWQRDTDSGRLRQATGDSAEAAAE